MHHLKLLQCFTGCTTNCWCRQQLYDYCQKKYQYLEVGVLNCFIIWEFFFLLLVSIPSIAAVWTLCGSSAIVCGRYSTLRQRSASHAQGSFRLGAITCCKAMLKLASYQKCYFITLSLCPPLNISAINGPFRGRPMRPIQPSHCGRQTGPPWLQPTRVCSVPSR